MPMEASTTLTVCIFVDGKEILLQALCNAEVTKGMLMGWTNVEPKSMHSLNETTFFATYAAGILAEEIGTAIEKINNWLGKPIVITCDEVTMTQLPHVPECAQCTVGVESVTFNHRTDDLHSDSLQSIHSGYHSHVTSPFMPGVTCPTILNKILGIPHFSGTEKGKGHCLVQTVVPCHFRYLEEF